MKPLIAGNWKMNGLSAARTELAALTEAFGGTMPATIDTLVCPPATLLSGFATAFSDAGLLYGGQDCHVNEAGAHTGDISAAMLADAGASFVIVGHSERRADHGETDLVVRAKAEAVLAAGLNPIVCVGETEAERKAGHAEAVVGAQLEGSLPGGPDNSNAKEVVVAYEPVWAIGTGLTPTNDDIAAMHRFIRSKVGRDTRILYGGSVKPANAEEILRLPDVGGALVGGASLKAVDFAAIIRAAIST